MFEFYSFCSLSYQWPRFFFRRNLVSDIHGKTGQLLSRGTGTAQQVGGAGGAYDNQQMIRVSRDCREKIRQAEKYAVYLMKIHNFYTIMKGA